MNKTVSSLYLTNIVVFAEKWDITRYKNIELHYLKGEHFEFGKR